MIAPTVKRALGFPNRLGLESSSFLHLIAVAGRVTSAAIVPGGDPVDVTRGFLD